MILPVPYEATTSWGAGTRAGPRAILEASGHLELYDEELDLEPHAAGIHTLPELELTHAGPEAAYVELHAAYTDLLSAAPDRFIVALGGEHSITPPMAAVWADRLGDRLSVLQLDAHADLRDAYHGTRYGHASAMRRVLDRTDRIVQVGIRSLTSEGRAVSRSRGLAMVLANKVGTAGWVETVVEALSDEVYLTFDLDFFDPSVIPATGTPEPGGATWWQAVELLRAVFSERRVVAADVVELAPRPGAEASAFTAAKLVYKMIAYHGAGAPSGGDGSDG